jgi:hypothetical protein
MNFGEKFNVPLSIAKLDIPQTLTDLIAKFNDISAAGNEAASVRPNSATATKDRP